MMKSNLKVSDFLGYAVGALNIYLFFGLIFYFSFSWFFFFLFFILLVFLNIIYSSLTYLYIDFQKGEFLNLRATDLFLLYGRSIYLTILLLPLAYFKIYGLINSVTTFFIFVFILFSVWVYRILSIRKSTNLSFLNLTLGVFFPHIFFSFFFIFGILFIGFLTYALLK